jgi:hypothetical protein
LLDQFSCFVCHGGAPISLLVRFSFTLRANCGVLDCHGDQNVLYHGDGEIRMTRPAITVVAVAFVLLTAWLILDRRSPASSEAEGSPISGEISADAVAAGPESRGGSQAEVPLSEAPDQSSDAVARFDWRRSGTDDSTTVPQPAPVRRATVASSSDRLSVREPAEARAPQADRTSVAKAPARTEARKRPETEMVAEPSLENAEPDDLSQDTQPPVLEWLRFHPASIEAGGEITLTAAVTDDLAGVREVVGRLSSPSGNAHVGFSLQGAPFSGTYQSTLKIPEKAEAGMWRVSWMRLTDRANNANDQRWSAPAAPPGGTLMVLSEQGDSEPPQLVSVTLDRSTVGPGEAVGVTARVTDDRSGVRFVSGTFQSPSGSAHATFSSRDQGGDLWQGSLTLPQDAECGEWTLRRITAIDQANNQAIWTHRDEQLAGVRFYLSFSGSCDSEPPVLSRLELSPRHISNAADHEITVTAFVDDSGSGVASVSGFAMAPSSGTGQPPRIHFVLSQISDAPGAPWSGVIRVPQYSVTGRWEIRALRVADNAGNQKTYGPADPAMAQGWFVVE